MDYFDPASTTTAAVFACSPRASGNSDQAAGHIADGIREAGGSCNLIQLRRFRVTACLGCGRCAHDPRGRCFLSETDHSGALFQVMLSAPVVIFSSPIFFYHLPAGFKAFIDRGQSYYMRRVNREPEVMALPRRPAFACVVAGRPQGEKLFEGALLTLKYFLEPFNRTLQEPLLFRGVDAPGDVVSPPERVQELRDFGALAWRSVLEQPPPGEP